MSDYETFFAKLTPEQRDKWNRWTQEQAAAEQREREAQPAYWLELLVEEVRILNEWLAKIETAIYSAAMEDPQP